MSHSIRPPIVYSGANSLMPDACALMPVSVGNPSIRNYRWVPRTAWMALIGGGSCR